MQISGNIINILERKIQYGTIEIETGIIQKISYESDLKPTSPYLLPGFIDAHVHVESSMLTPVQFARLAVVHGTVSTVSDPHEIGNVLGKTGVEYMIKNARQTVVIGPLFKLTLDLDMMINISTDTHIVCNCAITVF